MPSGAWPAAIFYFNIPPENQQASTSNSSYARQMFSPWERANETTWNFFPALPTPVFCLATRTKSGAPMRTESRGTSRRCVVRELTRCTPRNQKTKKNTTTPPSPSYPRFWAGESAISKQKASLSLSHPTLGVSPGYAPPLPPGLVDEPRSARLSRVTLVGPVSGGVSKRGSFSKSSESRTPTEATDMVGVGVNSPRLWRVSGWVRLSAATGCLSATIEQMRNTIRAEGWRGAREEKAWCFPERKGR